MTRARMRTGATPLVAILLLSCGGGGGDDDDGGGNPPPPPPPPSNLAPLDDNVVELAAETSLYSAEDAHYAMLLLTQAARDLQRNQLDSLPYSCSQNGTVTLSVNDANGNGALGAGDRVVIAYDACNFVASGTYRLDVTEAAFSSGAITALSGAFEIDLRYHTGAEPTLTGAGEMTYTAGTERLRWLARDFSVDWIDRTHRESLMDARVESVVDADSGYSFSFSGLVASDAVGGLFEVATGPSFRGQGGQWPMTGVLTATGRGNSTITYLAEGGSVFAAYEVDADADGVIDDLARSIGWSEISSGVAFGIFGDPDVPQPPSGPDLIGRRIPLGGSAKDLAVNASRGQAYVTIPERHELLVFSTDTLEVVRRVYLASQPAGLSVSADGDEIFVGLAAAGAIAILDADTFDETRIDVAAELQTSAAYKVVETAPGILYVSSGVENQQGRIARVDRGAGTVTAIAATAFAEIELLADPTRNLLYASDGAPADQPTLRKLDASVEATPSLQAFSITTGIEQMNRLSLSPTGNLIYAASGHVFDTSDFGPFGRITAGVPAASNNGTEAVVASGERDFVIHSALTLQEIDRLETNCWAPLEGDDRANSFSQVHRLAQSPVNGQWLLLGDEVLCVVDLLNPDVPPGTGLPGVPPPPIPTTTITTAKVHWSNTLFDAEYDDLRNRLYVSLYSAQELVTVDVASQSVIERQPLGHTARGLDLSPDGSTLAIMFNDNGHVAFKDLDSGVIETQDISALLGTTSGLDVQWWDDDILFASAEYVCCEEPIVAHLVRVSHSDPGASRRAAGGAHFWGAELAISPDRNFLYLNRGEREVAKLDLTQPDEPVVASFAQPEDGGLDYGGFTDPSISPDGERIVYHNLRVLRTSDFVQVGEIGAGEPLYAVDNSAIYAGFSGFIDRYDPASFQALERLEPTANCSSPWRMLTSADGRMLITAQQNGACFWMLDQPVEESVMQKAAHDAYTCGAACMLRKLRKAGSPGNEGGQPRSNR